MTGSAPTTSSFDWTSQRILVIDRDDQFRFWARGLFKHQRVSQILSAPTPGEARDLVLRHDIHVALIEVGHEETGWLPFLKWLRDRKSSPCPYLPVLLMVKTIDMNEMRLACGVGIHGLLRKPLSGEAVLKGVSSVLRNPRKLGWSGDGDHPVEAGGGTAAPSAIPARSVPGDRLGPAAAIRPRAAVEPSVAKAAIPRRAGTGAAGPGVRPLPSGGAPAGYGDDAPPAEKPKIAIELIEVETFAAPAPADKDDGWGEAVAEAPARKTRRADDDDERGFEPPAAAKPKPAAEVAAVLDVGQMLQDHALWMQSAATQGKRAALEGEDLSHQSFADADLSNALLRRCDLSGSDCTGAQLQSADLRNAELIGCTLIGSNLAVARLRHAVFRGCRFDGANLKGADLAGADLSEAKLGDADLTGANLLGVKLAGADLSGVSGLSQAQLESAVGNSKTRLPPGLFLPSPKER
jgi:CheY-like chemotaxis protein